MKTPTAAIALLLISEAALCGTWSYIGGPYPHAAFIESTTIQDEGQDTKGFWQHIIPDSMGESYFLFVCQKHDPMNYAIPDTPAMELWKIAQPLIKNNQ